MLAASMQTSTARKLREREQTYCMATAIPGSPGRGAYAARAALSLSVSLSVAVAMH